MGVLRMTGLDHGSSRYVGCSPCVNMVQWQIEQAAVRDKYMFGCPRRWREPIRHSECGCFNAQHSSHGSHAAPLELITCRSSHDDPVRSVSVQEVRTIHTHGSIVCPFCP